MTQQGNHWKVCLDIAALLDEKALKYGKSIENPIAIFSKVDKTTALRARIDDKLSRIARGVGDDEDTILDLIGYLVMLRVVQLNEKATSTDQGTSKEPPCPSTGCG